MNLKKELTVRPNQNAIGIRPPSFKVYRENPDGTLQIPRFFKGDTRKFHKGTSINIQFTGTLRSYQQEALDNFKGNGILCLPCGAGKTSTSLAIAAKMKRKTLVIVHKEFLANQWRERIAQFCPSSTVGTIQADTWDVDGHHFVIAMIQTLCVREHDPAQFSSFGMLIVDESHHIGAPAFSKTMFKLSPEFTLGLTATPERKDGLTCILYWFLGTIFYSMDQNTAELIVKRLDFDHPTFRAAPPMNKFGKVSLAHIVNHLVEIPERNEMILKHVREALARNKNILILSDRRGHCEWMHKQLGDKVSGLYMGGMKAEQHEEASHKQVIIATFSLAYEGLDIPSLNTLFLVTPHSDVKQAVGRITRTFGEKEVFDVVDNWCVLQSMYYKRKRNVYDPPRQPDECLFNEPCP
jgi:superfamily II DNA or RNA helicase